jgi:eukaryotic-like serine/threonine-protein kinase
MLEFDDFTLDIDGRALCRRGEPVHLAPKLLDTLILLVERRGQTVTKDEILQTIWPGLVVEEGGLARNISLLRKALGEEEGGRYIATIPKQGYRFVAAVRERTDTPTSGADSANALRRRRALLIALAAVVTAVTVVTLWFKGTSQQPHFEPLTTNAAAQAVVAAAVSPAGDYLAYYDLSGLYVRPIGSRDSRRIESPAGVVPALLEWFPDGAHLLASGFDAKAHKSAVWSIPILGGESHLLRADASMATVAPDGRRIAFIRRPNQIFLANADGGEARIFASLAATEGLALRLQFSPDGAYLLDGRGQAGSKGALIEARRLADGAVIPLLQLQTALDDFQLLSDGFLLFTRAFDDGQRGEQLEQSHVNLAAGAAGPVRILASFPGALAYGLSAVRDGHRVAMIKDLAQSDVYVADVDASGDLIANVRRLTFDDASDRPSGWLPDNRTVLFHSDRGGAGWRIYRQEIDAPTAQVLVAGDHDVSWPTVSPDQRWLLYQWRAAHVETPTLRTAFVRQPLLGGPPEVIDSRDLLYRSVRCPYRGDRCVLLEKSGDQAVFFALDPTAGRGGELGRVGWTPRRWVDWDVSPDGRQIAAVSAATPRNRITVIPIDGGAAAGSTITVDGYQWLGSLRWDASGAGFFASSTDAEVTGALLHIHPDGSATYLRRQLNGDGWAIPSADGRHLALQEWTMAGNVWIFGR